MKYLPTLLVLALGCRHCPTHCEKPKVKHKLTSRFEPSTILYAEGFGSNKPHGAYGPSPCDSVNLKGVFEYSVEW